MAGLTIGEAIRQFPFLNQIQIKHSQVPLEVQVVDFDDNFLNLSLVENESSAAGHFNVSKDLYVARDGKLCPVGVSRSPTRIWPPAYLHPGMKGTDEDNDDELGYSESMREALSRQDMARAQFVLLYTNGSDGSEHTNEIVIAPTKK
jgi:hypothetical protein